MKKNNQSFTFNPFRCVRFFESKDDEKSSATKKRRAYNILAVSDVSFLPLLPKVWLDSGR